MASKSQLPNRRSLRKRGYDYSKSGWYFVTICTQGGINYFGSIKNGSMYLYKIGRAAEKFWYEISQHFDYVHLDEFVIMPNHIHGIIYIREDFSLKSLPDTGVQLNARIRESRESRESNMKNLNKKFIFSSWLYPQKRTLSVIIRTYKGAVTTWCRKNGYLYFKWLRSYHDQIINSAVHLMRARIYIRNNPVNWNK